MEVLISTLLILLIVGVIGVVIVVTARQADKERMVEVSSEQARIEALRRIHENGKESEW